MTRVPSFGRTLGALGLAVLVGGAAHASAQDAGASFTVQQAITALHDGNTLLVAAEHRELAADADVTRAGLWTNPIVSADYFYGALQSSYDPAGTGILSVQQLFETSDVPGARARAMREELAAVHEERDAVRIFLEIEVQAACIDLAAALDAVVIARESAGQLEAMRHIIDARVAGGAAARYDGHRIAIALAEAVALVDTLEADVIAARAQLDAVVGPLAERLAGRPAVDLDTLPSLPNLAALREQIVDTRADLRAARARARGAQAIVDVAQRSVFQGFALRLQTGFGQGPGQFDVGIGLSLPLPVLDYGQGSIQGAEQRAEVARYAADSIQYTALVRLEGAHREAAQRIEAASRYTDSVTEIRSDMRAEIEAAYREARVSVLELVDAYLSTRDAALRRLALTRDAMHAVLEIERALRVGDVGLGP
jgi:outer membrane protein TolC